MLIVQITDMHVGRPQPVRGPGRAKAEVDPSERLARAVAHINALDPRPDFLIATGDLTADGRPEEYAELADLLSGLAMPFTLIPGNHDDRDNLRAAFPALDFGSPGSDRGPEQGGEALLCHSRDLGSLRLIALDTLLPGQGGGELGAAQLAWLESCLAEAGEQPVVLALHHPPAAVAIPGFDAMRCHDGEALAELVARHERIEAVICGHVHRAISLRWAGTALHVTPSTAYQYALTMQQGEALRPVDEPRFCRLLAWLPETGLVSHLSPIA